MTEIIAIKFKKDGRIYYFDPNGITFHDGENRNIPDSKIVAPLKKVLRSATPSDLKKVEENEKKALLAFDYCEEQISKLGLDMKLIDVEISFDSGKMLFFFTSDGRVDFRELVKILAANYKTRIELRQIGVRDEAKLLGGLGICGQPFCCSRFLDDFQPVYEQDAYEYLNSITPSPGSIVKTPDGEGIVHDVNLLSGMLLVKMGEDNAVIKKVHKDDVKVIRAYRGKGKKSQNTEENENKK